MDPPVMVASDTSDLAHLVLHEARSAWQWDPVPSCVLPISSNSDVTGRMIEQAAARDFAFAGGAAADRTADLVEWKAVFQRRRLTMAKEMIMNALSGTHRKQDDNVQRRKKDLPDPKDKVGIRRLLSAQALQETLVARRHGPGRALRVAAAANQAVTGNRAVWNAPSGQAMLAAAQQRGVIAAGGDLEALERPTRGRCLRVVLDDVASERECALAIGAAVVGMDAQGDAAGETVLIASPPDEVRPTLGEGTTRLLSLLLWRVQRAVHTEFDDRRPLYLAGAMLTRLQPPPPPAPGAQGATPAHERPYDYSVAHVDRANVGSYDYSAVLYLNTKGRGFEGGDFAFVDDGGDEAVEPRRGRCVLFTSGFEHLHRVAPVAAGSRFVLAAWFTLSAAAGDALRPAHYQVQRVPPPPSPAETRTQTESLDHLQRRLDDEIQRRQRAGSGARGSR